MKSLLSRCRINCIKRRLGDLPALSQNSVCLVKMVNLDRAAASGIAPVSRVKQTTILAKINLRRPWNRRAGIQNLFAGEINFDNLSNVARIQIRILAQKKVLPRRVYHDARSGPTPRQHSRVAEDQRSFRVVYQRVDVNALGLGCPEGSRKVDDQVVCEQD